VEIDNLYLRILPEVGAKKATLLEQELGARTFEEMLYHLPYRYVDRTRFYTIAELSASLPHVQVRARVSRLVITGEGRRQHAVATADDGTGELELVWFKGYKYLAGKIVPGAEYVIFGKPTLFNSKLNVVHPEIEPFDADARPRAGLQALYPTTGKMKKGYLNSKAISNIQAAIFRRLHERVNETLPAWFIREHRLVYLHDALYTVHFPRDAGELDRALYRLKFEELFYIQLHVLKQKFRRKVCFQGHPFTVVGDYFHRFYDHYLPFPLTGAQKRVIREIRRDCGSGKQMNRLLQGDVGSGKTLVAVMCMLLALDNGFQACIMAPTAILAAQHHETISGLLREMGVNVGLLTGSTKKKEREKIHAGLADGSLQVLVGTHALLEDAVSFREIGLVVIDEQHRFGVAQRAKLWGKNAVPPHVLVMTATPIPRTLAMTLYGDLDVSVIDEMPPGRKPVNTRHVHEERRFEAYAFLRGELERGRQAYVVYPLISESETMDYRNLEEGYEQVNGYFGPLGFRAGIVHGRLKAAEKEEQMRRFVEGETRILVATTVIEVGVNVPNATVMLVESAERFGLSQLHQLRGRVGRGGDQAYCILMTSYRISADSRKRIDTMTSTNDGFVIAEADMKLRGAGDVDGTRQSGLACNLRVADLGKDEGILCQAARTASEILEKDPELVDERNAVLAVQVKRIFKTRVNWRYIS
jgi:ATP-dependent DNA helicase RecG